MLLSKPKEITISSKTTVTTIGWIVATVLLFRFIKTAAHPITLILVAFFLTLALNPSVHWLASKLKSKSRARATAIAYLIIVVILVGFMATVLPPLIRQTGDFIGSVPQTLKNLEGSGGFVGDLVRKYDLSEQVTHLANTWSSNFSAISNSAVSIASRIVANLVSIFTVFVLTFMMLVEGPHWLAVFWRHYPANKRKHAEEISMKMYKVVTSYVNGQVLVAAIGATFATIALTILSAIFNASGINPIAMGGIIFMFALIPTIGTIMGSSIVIIFCLFSSAPLALAMTAYIVVYQQIENVSIQPMIQSRGNELTPLLVFMSALLGIGFGGPLGAFIAIPIAGCLKVLVDDYFARHRKDQPSSANS